MTHYHKLCNVLIFVAAFNCNLTAQNPTTETTVETNKSNIIVTNEKTINTGQLEFSPAFYEDGIVYITSQKPMAKEKIFDERIESSTMSIFLARRNEHGQLDKPAAFSNAFVSSLHEGPISYALVSFANEKGEIKSIPTDQLGAFSICVPCGSAYRAYATKDGKMSTVKVATTRGMDCNEGVEKSLPPIELKIAAPVSKDFTINEGNSIQLRNIYYNFNDATIRPDARKDLEALFVVMTKFPDLVIELASHTDARGTNVYNDDLSQRRANSAVQYLVNRGIDARRIIAKGYGESMLRNSCADGVPCLESQHKLNRRTEVKITKSGSAEGQILTDFFTPETWK